MDKSNLKINIEKTLELLPDYIRDYHRSKLVAERSLLTLYEYYHEFKRFFEWLIDADIVQNKSNIKEITLSDLEHLPKVDVEAYFAYLKERPRLTKGLDKTANNYLSEEARMRTYRSLSSLFRYLSEESENEAGEPYFYRNVMKKVTIGLKNKETLQSKSRRFNEKVLTEDEVYAFLEFIENEETGYYRKAGLDNKPRARSSFRQNKERDLAIIALLLATGIRLNEAVNMNVEDLNLFSMTATVIRKGNKKDSPHIAPFARPYLENYLDIRTKKYFVTDKDNVNEKQDKVLKKAEQLSKDEPALFLSVSKGVPKRLKGKGIEDMVKKYSKAYGKEITPHKLRHTLATILYRATTNDVVVATQLGHSSTALISVYAHANSREIKDGLDKL